MERILIDSRVLSFARRYDREFRKKGHDVPGDLRSLKNDLARLNTNLSSSLLDQYMDYLEDVALDYENEDPENNLLLIKPDDIDVLVKEYEDKYSALKLDRDLVYKIQIGGKSPGPKKKKFWELIVDTMHYGSEIRQLMVPIIEELGIKSCVYCNVQYALTVNHSKGMFELDHRLPKSKYPFLCISFFNLQPSCPSCNHGKKTEKADFGLYTTDETKLKPFHLLTNPHFYLDNGIHDPSRLTVHLVATDVNNIDQVLLAYNHESTFDIDATYRELVDVAEETIWRCRAYDNTYKRLFLKYFRGLYDKESLHRFIFGTYVEGNVHKRPLTKLIRDIEEDMEVVVAP